LYLPSYERRSSKALSISWSSSLSCGSSRTSVSGRLAENPSVDSRMVGEDARDEVELDSLEWPHVEKVGVAGVVASDWVEERESW